MKSRRFLLSVFLLIVGVFAGLVIASKAGVASLAESQEEVKPAPSITASLDTAVINVAQVVGKAVVSISTEHISKPQGGRKYYYGQPFNAPFGDNDPFRDFFEDFFGNLPEREFKQVGLGSGVVIDPRGYILTNEHVVENADKITVTLPDGREFKGEVKGKDPRSDLAVIKINATGLPSTVLGDSSAVKIGQWVVAIGNPFGFALDNPEPTVTVGVISALHRSLGRALSRDKDFSDLIQTDAAINPGNSGGPLVNLKGEIIGINTALFSTTGGYQGVGFAIPVNTAKRIISRLIEGKEIAYGWLGLTVQDLNDDLAAQFGLGSKNGVLIAKVIENGPAQKAGLKDGDVIKRFGEADIKNVKELLSVVGSAEVGRKIRVSVVREKKDITVDVIVAQRPDRPGESLGEENAEKGQTWKGLEVKDLASIDSRRFKADGKAGIAVSRVEPGSAGDEAGIIPGDIIQTINRQAVKDISDYTRITKGLKGNALVKTNRGFFVIKGDKQ